MIESGQHSPSLRCWAEIDLTALERNIHRIREELPAHIRFVAVVKADAYGHGINPTATRLMQAGVDLFAVANVREGRELREIGSGWKILILSPVLPDEEPHLLRWDLIPTVSSIDEVQRFSRLAEAGGKQLPVHLKIDTGMGRLGVWWENAAEVIQAILKSPGLRLDGVFTHFSDAAHAQDFTGEQRQRFLSVIRQHALEKPEQLLIHADNSSGLESFCPDSPFNAVRVGLLQFGVTEYPRSLFKAVRIEPVLSFYAKVGLIKNLPAGTAISYGRTHTLSRDSRVAILTVGYGDGLPARAGNRAQVLLRGKRCPVIGRVTMDQTIVDITDLPAVEIGERAILIGRSEQDEITVTEFGHWADSIPWEVFCSITKRVPRVYRTDRT